MTAMAIQALAPYESQPEVSAAITRAVPWLSTQNIADAEGNAQVIVALSALGIDAQAYVNALLTFYDEASGGFIREGMVDLMATEQAAYALVAYDRYKTNRNSLYDMSDAVKLVSGNVTPAEADKTALVAEIARAESLRAGDYTSASWSAMQIALNNAKTVAANTSATQAVVDSAASSLTSAISNLRAPDPAVQKKYVRISVTDHGATGGQTSVYFPLAELEMNVNETAFSLLQRTGLSIRTATYPQYAGVYVEAINGFGEFSDGPLSGWMYSVNGVFPGYSASLYTLKDGDVVAWVYTRDLGDDVGGGEGNGAPGSVINIDDEKTPLANLPENSVTKEVAAEVKNDTVVAVVKTGVISELIGKAKEDGKTNITLIVTDTNDARSIELDLTVESLGDLVTSSMSLTVQSDNGTIIFDTETLAGIAAGKPEDMPVRIIAEGVPQASLTAEQRTIVGSNPVIDLSVWAGNTRIHDFKGVVTVMLSEIPKNVMPEDYDLLTVYCLDENASPAEMKDAKYNAATGEIIFTADHFSLFFAAEWINPYTDVIKTDWYYRSVRFARSEGLMSGTGADTFAPETNLSRAMIVQILYNLEGCPSYTGGKAFDDVKAGEWYYDAVAWASANGIVSGYGNGLFGPNDDITREQLATILHRYSQLIGIAEDQPVPLSDVPAAQSYTDLESVSSWALDGMLWANTNGLITGRTASTLVPKGDASRAEAATIFTRFVSVKQRDAYTNVPPA